MTDHDDFSRMTEEEKRAYLRELIRKAEEIIDKGQAEHPSDEVNIWD